MEEQKKKEEEDEGESPLGQLGDVVSLKLKVRAAISPYHQTQIAAKIWRN